MAVRWLSTKGFMISVYLSTLCVLLPATQESNLATLGRAGGRVSESSGRARRRLVPLTHGRRQPPTGRREATAAASKSHLALSSLTSTFPSNYLLYSMSDKEQLLAMGFEAARVDCACGMIAWPSLARDVKAGGARPTSCRGLTAGPDLSSCRGS